MLVKQNTVSCLSGCVSQEDAEKLLRNCKRFDLLNEFYQSHGDWDKVGFPLRWRRSESKVENSFSALTLLVWWQACMFSDLSILLRLPTISKPQTGVRRSTGRIFHTIRPLMEKLRSPRFVLVQGTCSWYRSAGRRREWSGWSDDAWQNAARYGGARPWTCTLVDKVKMLKYHPVQASLSPIRLIGGVRKGIQPNLNNWGLLTSCKPLLWRLERTYA